MSLDPNREKGVVTLCGVKGCCPTIDFTDSTRIIIKDDFGGNVQLTPEQWAELKKFGEKK